MPYSGFDLSSQLWDEGRSMRSVYSDLSRFGVKLVLKWKHGAHNFFAKAQILNSFSQHFHNHQEEC